MKKMQVTIPVPCHEDWNKMTPVEQGRFCGSCQKKVIDFTGMSDAQLIAFFRKPSTGSVCGRLMEDQLGREMNIPRKRIPWFRYFFQFAIPAFLVSSKAVAQGEVRQLKTDSSAICTPDLNIRGGVTMILPERFVSGRILNDEEEGIPGILVSIKGTSLNCRTDSSGYFKLSYRGMDKKIILTLQADGFEEKEEAIKLGRKANSSRYVELSMQKKEEEDVIVVAGMIALNKN